ncbi:MAG: ABC transporter ATP-binding protein, partial [Clostridia bacterium]
KVKNGTDVYALSGVNITVRENEFICVVGPSGCGKTTMLNIIAGLESYDKGEVTIRGQAVIGPGPDRAVIFQQYALFPWMTVIKNIEFAMKFLHHDVEYDAVDKKTGLAVKKTKSVKYTKAEKEEIARHYIKLVDLQGFEKSYPSALSGGMKQRVAIARSYVTNADVLLMDEPFGAVDAQTRAQLQEDLLRTWATEQKTCFFITHDVEEAALLATKVIVMSARPGRVKKVIDINLPYPRTQATKLEPEFIKFKNEIWSEVYQEYLEVRK